MEGEEFCVSVVGVRIMGPPETAIPFAPAKAVNSDDALDHAGYIVLGMLEQAAAATAQNCQHAVDVAQKISLKLRAAQDRIKDLQAETAHYQERAVRAEQWLLRISQEIEQRFLDAKADHSRPAARRQSEVPTMPTASVTVDTQDLECQAHRVVRRALFSNKLEQSLGQLADTLKIGEFKDQLSPLRSG